MTDPARFAPLILALLALCGLAGCDNPSCVFGGDCSGGGGGGGVGAFPATFPENHEWIRSGAPNVIAAFPDAGSGSGAATAAATTPIVLVFDESLAPDTLADAFELSEMSSGGGPGGPGGPGGGLGAVPLEPPLLVGNGRVVVLLPQAPLMDGASYELTRTAAGPVTDLEGSRWTVQEDSVLARFTVEMTPSTAPRLVASFPLDGATNQSATGEIVTVFDRPLDPSSISLASFAVTVDGLSPPVNPLAQPLVSGADTEARVLTWQAVDPVTGDVAPLTLGGTVTVALSPTGAPLVAAGAGTPLASQTTEYELADFQAPTSIVLQTASGNAIGIEDLVGPMPLTVDLTFLGAEDGDRVVLYLFGADPGGLAGGGGDIALRRQKTIGAVASDTWTAAEVDLAAGGTPVEPRVGDGFVAFAFAVERGDDVSPVRLLDVDPVQPGIQDPVLDTLRPTLEGFGASGTSASSFVSDTRDLVVLGRASEALGFADVDAPGLGSHGPLTPVAGSTADGGFLARRIAIGGPAPGLLDPALAQDGVPFTITLYDRAHNASNPIQGTFFQVGASGPGAALPGAGTVAVEVRRADTLAAIANARVFVHEGATGQRVDGALTDSAGRAALEAATMDTVLTVDAAGFDLFTWCGVPTGRMSVLVAPTNPSPGLASGSVTSPDAGLDDLERFLGDSRRIAGSEPLIQLLSCSLGPDGDTVCPYSPGPVVPRQAGALGFVGVVTPVNEAAYTPTGFLRAFALERPALGLGPGDVENRTIELGLLFDDPNLPGNALPVDGPAFTYQDTLANSDGSPRASVEGLVHGLTGGATVGAAATFDQGGGDIRVRTAIPGAANAGGTLVTGEVLEPELFVRVESRDPAGNRAGRRPRVGAANGTLQPPALPSITAPASGSTTSGATYTVVVTDVLPDGVDGLYTVALRGSNGRTWRLHRVDASGMTSVSLLVPEIAAFGGSALPSGAVVATSSVRAWSGFDASALAFSDLETRVERYATAVGHTFSQP